MDKDKERKLFRHYYFGALILTVFLFIFFLSFLELGFNSNRGSLFFTITILVACYLLIGWGGIFEKFEIIMSGINPVIGALIINLLFALGHYFVLLIVFAKDPPVAVGLPYRIYSFTQQKVLVEGFLLNYFFYMLVAWTLAYLHKLRK